MKFASWLSSFARLSQFSTSRSHRRRTPRFPTVCERYEERVVPSAPNITNLVAPTQSDEGSWFPVEVTFDCDDYDTLNTVRWSDDGGVTWSESQVYVYGTATESFYFGGPEQGTATWDLEITDSEANTTSANGSVTINNVAPTLTITSSPAGSTVHENQDVYLSGSLWDPAFNGDSTADPLTITIDWGAGPAATRIETLVLTPPTYAGFSFYHAYNLPSDQSITITVTVDDGDTGIDTESISLTYDDVISGLDGEGHGAVAGSLHFLLSANTEVGTIASYDVDVDRDGSYDVHMDIDEDTWDSENVAILEAASLSLLGNPTSSASFTGRFMVTTTGGFFDYKDMPITITNAAAGGPTPDAPGAGATTDNVNSTTTITYDATFIQDQFKVLGRNPMGIHVTKKAAGGTVTLSADELRNNFNQGIAGILWYGLDFRASLLAMPAPGVAAMPYFVQYAYNETTTTDPTTGNTTTVTTRPWGLDGPSNADANHPNMYGWQTIGSSTAAMSDQPGLAIGVKIQPKRVGNSVELRMVRTITAELAQNPLHQQAWAAREKQTWTFETYVAKRDVVTGVLTSLGYLQWKFEVTATAAGFTAGWGFAPVWWSGSGPQWNL